mmetsp:Transcript_13212/g.16114  ORF Transcript_13212/g.16114 Transcript_13212/m.16114 type:complete len:89 (+) Transcript_13212:237-503(+)
MLLSILAINLFDAINASKCECREVDSWKTLVNKSEETYTDVGIEGSIESRQDPPLLLLCPFEIDKLSNESVYRFRDPTHATENQTNTR